MARGTFYTTQKIGPKQSKTPEGFLLCEEVPIARTGLMIYGPDETPIEAGPDGITKIYREDADVFRPETIASAQGKSVADDHPEEDVTPDNWKELTVGIMLNVRRGEKSMDDLLLADLLITDPVGIKAVESGKREVSLGYEADYEEVSAGVGKQSNIIINHVALVEQGRCGPRCAIGDKKPILTKESTVAKRNVLDMLMKAFKAKDAAEVEKLAAEAKDDFETPAATTSTEGGDTHIHIHTGDNPEAVTEPVADESEIAKEGITNDDDALSAHIEQNASEHAEMMARIEALEKLVGANAGATDDDVENEEMAEAMKDEVPEEVAEAAAKAKDSAYLGESFKDTVAMAEILVPGIKIPTYDRAAKPGQTFKKICGLRKQALDLAYVQPATRSVMDDLLGGKNLDTKNMTCDAARVLFRSAAAAQRVANNGKRVTDSSPAKPQVVTSIAEINRRNAERYKQS